MPEVNRRWIYPTVTASENKGIERIALSGEGTAHEVVGIDGSRKFGCRPSSGFRNAHSLAIETSFSSEGSRPFSSVAPPTQNKSSYVTDCFPVHFQIKENEFATGFVYRVKQRTGVVPSKPAAVYIDWCPTMSVNSATGWRTNLISDHSSSNLSGDEKMNVVSTGRYVFVLVQGRKTRVFYVEDVRPKATATFTFGDTEYIAHANETITLTDADGLSKTYKIVTGTPGGGTSEFEDGDNASACATNFAAVVNGANGHNGTITAVANASAGKVDLTQATGGVDGHTTISHTSNWDAICDVNPPSVFSGGDPSYEHKIVDGGPGLSHTSATPTDNNNAQWGALGAGESPRFAVEDGSSGDPGHSTAHPLLVGDYSMAFFLHSSLTGRRSPLSEIQEVSVTSSPTKKLIRFEAETSKFDQIYLFRSVRLQAVGGVYAGSILHLDGIYDLRTNGTYTKKESNDSAPYGGTYEVFQVHYQLDDIALAMQDVFLDRASYDEEMPHSGTGVAFSGSMIVADPQGPSGDVTQGPYTLQSTVDRKRNVGEVRWSSLTERSPELFPINNKYSPDVYQNRVTKLERAGDFAIGFSSDRVYHIRRSGIYLLIDDLHAGYGLSGFNATASVGPLVYFVTNKGMKAVANNGQLDDVQALDNLLLEDWYNNLSNLRMAADPYAGCLFVLNPELEQTVCMWFGTGRISEFHDTSFSDVRPGIWPQDYASVSPTVTPTTTMVERSFFLQNHPATSFSKVPVEGNIPAGWKPRVYVLDYDRDKVVSGAGGSQTTNGTKVVRTLDFVGDAIFPVASTSTATGYTTVTVKKGSYGALTLSAGSAYDLVGGYAYVVSSTDATKIGTKRQIHKAAAGSVGSDTTTITVPEWTELAADDVIAISPMLFRYVGGALPMIRSKDNQVVSSFDMFQNKQISSLGCHFSDVSGGTTGFKFFRGLVFNTESDSAAVSAFPTDFAGSTIGDSIKNGESDDYAAFTATGLTTKGRHGIQDSALNPGVEIFCPDVDFKLMAVICRGRTTGTDTGERNTS